MENNHYVLDANVFLEYIFGRPSKHHSQQLIKDAILNGAIFITNDKKHISKVKQFGYIQNLSDVFLAYK